MEKDNDSLFSKEGTIARSSQDVVRFFYLERLELMLRAEKSFNNTLMVSADYPRALTFWASCVSSLLSLCRPRMLKQEKRLKDYSFCFVVIDELLSSNSPVDLKKASYLLVEYLENDLKLTDISKINDFDRTNIILSNKEKGYK